MDTTCPAAETASDGALQRKAAIHWLHPSSAIHVLRDGQIAGREPSCDIALTGHEISRQHAEIGMKGLIPIVRDLESRNGVFVNAQRVEQAPIGPGDVLRIGQWVGIAVEVAPEHASERELREIGSGWYGGPVLESALAAARQLAAHDLPVVIQGESGSGKEGAARAVHAWSGRRGEFIAIDCGTLPEHLAEGQLFGHRKGAFTGADRAQIGHFRAAEGGTLFLDEILNLSLALQSKLLRVLERREVLPLGESKPVPIDVRIVCAAQEPLPGAVTSGRFRADLLARLDGVTIELPPLRARREDVVPLFSRLIAELSPGGEKAMDPRFVESLLVYDWPLNVRELVLLARRLAALHAHEPVLRKSMLPKRIVEFVPRAPGQSGPRPERAPADDEAAFEALLASLREHGGNVLRACEALGITRPRAYRLLRARPEFDISEMRKEPTG